ncbi:MAG: LysM peptidoglycan-binding domain-containing protein, partial [Dehalococcoidia bacterium]
MGSLADEYGTTVTILRKANPGSLYAGRKIVVPVTETTAGGSLAERLGLNYDLVFIADGDLGIWKADTGKLHVFREPF